MFIEKIDNLCLGVDSKRPKTKCPITKHPRFQNVQCYKMSKATKSPNNIMFNFKLRVFNLLEKIQIPGEVGFPGG